MLKILFLAANPLNSNPLRLDEEARAIDDALYRARYRALFVLETHWATRIGDLQGPLVHYIPF